MKLPYFSTFLFLFSIVLLAWTVAVNPPANISWTTLYSSTIPLTDKAQYLGSFYAPPLFFAFIGMTLLQGQFRLAMSGAKTITIFSICMLASLCMIAGIRTAAGGPASFPGYAVGMALSYTMMSRVYAVTTKPLFGAISVPWIIWRGDAKAVAELNQQIAERRQSAVAGR